MCSVQRAPRICLFLEGFGFWHFQFRRAFLYSNSVVVRSSESRVQREQRATVRGLSGSSGNITATGATNKVGMPFCTPTFSAQDGGFARNAAVIGGNRAMVRLAIGDTHAHVQGISSKQVFADCTVHSIPYHWSSACRTSDPQVVCSAN